MGVGTLFSILYITAVLYLHSLNRKCSTLKRTQMNRIYTQLLSALLILLVLTSQAQSGKKVESREAASSGAKCFDESSKVINLGVGFWGGNYYRYGKGGGYSYGRSPALSLSYEQALPKKIGPGLLGLGVYLGYQTFYSRYNDWYYNGNQYYYKHNWTHMFVAARGAYHADALTTDKGELYFGAVLGLRFQKYSYESNNLDNREFELRERSVYPGYSLFVGGRYYLTDNIGLFAELGYGISYLTAGVSLKF